MIATPSGEYPAIAALILLLAGLHPAASGVVTL
jgi:hypothetical protein